MRFQIVDFRFKIDFRVQIYRFQTYPIPEFQNDGLDL
jgi:hypothetical protein